MAEQKFDEDKISGFSWYSKDKESKGILIPTAAFQTIQAETEADVKTAKAETGKATQEQLRHGGMPLPKIRVQTNHDIEDAVSFAEQLLADVRPPILLPAKFSQDLLAGIVLVISYEEPDSGMDAVLYYLEDPTWDNPGQIFSGFAISKLFVQQSSAAWLELFKNEHKTLHEGASYEEMTKLFQNVKLHWSTALEKQQETAGNKKPVVDPEPITTEVQSPARTIQVFCPQAIEKAVTALYEMSSRDRVAGERILVQADADGGNRNLPDAIQASKNLEAKKLDFENLLQPIERLQTDLVLAQAMGAQDFRISPLLLLGEPGIGKTFLASQLAQALGVPSEKISAGSAQGGFQLTGAHSTWSRAKPGMVAALLAKSASAAPVLIIDEVDKIQDGRYPFLPVLLDLLDAGTAQRFRDEFFEMEFDASRIIVVLTANDISKVPPPLLSRVEAITVPSPQPGQRLRIIEQTMADLSEKTGHAIAFSPGVAERLAERMDIDLRQLTRLVTVSFATALQAGDKVARIKAPHSFGPIGFKFGFQSERLGAGTDLNK